MDKYDPETNPTICPVCGVDTALWENLNHSHRYEQD